MSNLPQEFTYLLEVLVHRYWRTCIMGPLVWTAHQVPLRQNKRRRVLANFAIEHAHLWARSKLFRKVSYCQLLSMLYLFWQYADILVALDMREKKMQVTPFFIKEQSEFVGETELWNILFREIHFHVLSLYLFIFPLREWNKFRIHTGYKCINTLEFVIEWILHADFFLSRLNCSKWHWYFTNKIHLASRYSYARFLL